MKTLIKGTLIKLSYSRSNVQDVAIPSGTNCKLQLQLNLNISGCVCEYLALVGLGLVGIFPSESVSVWGEEEGRGFH